MGDDLATIIRAMPDDAFREPDDPLKDLSQLDRLRWLQQTAHFIWRNKGATRGGDPPGAPDR
jgi:hypothetical protein